MKKTNASKVKLLSTILAIVLAVGWWGGMLYRSSRYVHDFQLGAHYCEKEAGLSDNYAARRSQLAEWGVDFTAVPGSHGQVLTFTAPRTVSTYRSGNTEEPYRDTVIPKGTTLSSDFVVWSHHYGKSSWSYSITITLNGKVLDTNMKRRDVIALYRAALEQNGLADQFQTDTGSRLTRRSAKKALAITNKQIYDLGIYHPQGYPFNNERLSMMLSFAIPLAPLLAYCLGVIVLYIQMTRNYRAFLKNYNAEHIARWDKIAGTLPQFTSYAQSGIRDPGEKPKLRDAFRAMFQPVEKR